MAPAPKARSNSIVTCDVKGFLSATTQAPTPLPRSPASRTRVRNQRRITTAVRGLCNAPRMGHLPGYARVSTTDQQPQFQVDALTAAGCYRVFTETASGARTDRPVLKHLLDQLRPRRHPGCLEARPARPLPVTPGRHHHEPGRLRRRVPQPPGGDRHHLPRRQARLPRVRRSGRVRTRPHP